MRVSSLYFFLLSVAKKLLRLFDLNRSGAIELDEYYELHQFLHDAQNKFFTADKDRSQDLNAQELVSATFPRLSLNTSQGPQP